MNTDVFAGTTKFSASEQENFSRGRAASENVLRKTFDAWMDIARAAALARHHADAGGGGPKTRNIRFREILDGQQLSWIGVRNRSTEVSHLLAIMARLKEVQIWRASLPDDSRSRWSSPQSVWNRCPIFHPKGRTRGSVVRPRPMSVSELLKMPADDISKLIFARSPAKAFAILRSLQEVSETVAKPNGWAVTRARERAGASVAAA